MQVAVARLKSYTIAVLGKLQYHAMILLLRYAQLDQILPLNRTSYRQQLENTTMSFSGCEFRKSEYTTISGAFFALKTRTLVKWRSRHVLWAKPRPEYGYRDRDFSLRHAPYHANNLLLPRPRVEVDHL
jgi:hypothetical protein